MEVSSQPRPLYTPGKEPLALTGLGGLDGPQRLFGRYSEKNRDRSARTLVTIPTELSMCKSLAQIGECTKRRC